MDSSLVGYVAFCTYALPDLATQKRASVLYREASRNEAPPESGKRCQDILTGSPMTVISLQRGCEEEVCREECFLVEFDRGSFP